MIWCGCMDSKERWVQTARGGEWTRRTRTGSGRTFCRSGGDTPLIASAFAASKQQLAKNIGGQTSTNVLAATFGSAPRL